MNPSIPITNLKSRPTTRTRQAQLTTRINTRTLRRISSQLTNSLITTSINNQNTRSIITRTRITNPNVNRRNTNNQLLLIIPPRSHLTKHKHQNSITNMGPRNHLHLHNRITITHTTRRRIHNRISTSHLPNTITRISRPQHTKAVHILPRNIRHRRSQTKLTNNQQSTMRKRLHIIHLNHTIQRIIQLNVINRRITTRSRLTTIQSINLSRTTARRTLKVRHTKRPKNTTNTIINRTNTLSTRNPIRTNNKINPIITSHSNNAMSTTHPTNVNIQAIMHNAIHTISRRSKTTLQIITTTTNLVSNRNNVSHDSHPTRQHSIINRITIMRITYPVRRRSHSTKRAPRRTRLHTTIISPTNIRSARPVISRNHQGLTTNARHNRHANRRRHTTPTKRQAKTNVHMTTMSLILHRNRHPKPNRQQGPTTIRVSNTTTRLYPITTRPNKPGNSHQPITNVLIINTTISHTALLPNLIIRRNNEPATNVQLSPRTHNHNVNHIRRRQSHTTLGHTVNLRARITSSFRIHTNIRLSHTTLLYHHITSRTSNQYNQITTTIRSRPQLNGVQTTRLSHAHQTKDRIILRTHHHGHKKAQVNASRSRNNVRHRRHNTLTAPIISRLYSFSISHYVHSSHNTNLNHRIIHRSRTTRNRLHKLKHKNQTTSVRHKVQTHQHTTNATRLRILSRRTTHVRRRRSSPSLRKRRPDTHTFDKLKGNPHRTNPTTRRTRLALTTQHYIAVQSRRPEVTAYKDLVLVIPKSMRNSKPRQVRAFRHHVRHQMTQSNSTLNQLAKTISPTSLLKLHLHNQHRPNRRRHRSQSHTNRLTTKAQTKGPKSNTRKA